MSCVSQKKNQWLIISVLKCHLDWIDGVGCRRAGEHGVGDVHDHEEGGDDEGNAAYKYS